MLWFALAAFHFCAKTCTWAIVHRIKFHESGFDIAPWAIDFSVLYFHSIGLHAIYIPGIIKTGLETFWPSNQMFWIFSLSQDSCCLYLTCPCDEGRCWRWAYKDAGRLLFRCYLKTSGGFQSFWEGTGRSNGFLDVYIYYSLQVTCVRDQIANYSPFYPFPSRR